MLAEEQLTLISQPNISRCTSSLGLLSLAWLTVCTAAVTEAGVKENCLIIPFVLKLVTEMKVEGGGFHRSAPGGDQIKRNTTLTGELWV